MSGTYWQLLQIPNELFRKSGTLDVQVCKNGISSKFMPVRLIHNLIFCIFFEFTVYYFLQVVLNFNLKKRQFIKSCIPGSVFVQQAAESYFVKKRKSFRGTQKEVLLTYKKQLEVHEKRKCRFRTFERCRHYYFLS